MKDIELPPLPEPDHFAFIDGGHGIYVEGGPTGEPFYSAEQMQAYARAAVEADRAQRGLDTLCDDDLSDLAHSANQEALSFGLSHDVFLRYFKEVRRRLLASTPAQPAQKPTTSVPWMTARRAVYFMERFLHEEKMLGPNEQDALRFTIEALEAMATTHQAPPQPVERKPMTDDAVSQALFWLDAALKCSNFHWDHDQRECAEAALHEARQEPPQPVERKPMTPEQVAETILEMNGNEPSALFWRDLVSAVERHHGIRE